MIHMLVVRDWQSPPHSTCDIADSPTRTHSWRYSHSFWLPGNRRPSWVPTLSDHAYITFGVDLQFSRRQCAGSVRRRQWRRFDYDEFCNDQTSSVMRQLTWHLLRWVAAVTARHEASCACQRSVLRPAMSTCKGRHSSPRASLSPNYIRPVSLWRRYRRTKTAASREAWRR